MAGSQRSDNELYGRESRLPPLEATLDRDTVLWWAIAITGLAWTAYHVFYAYDRGIPQNRHVILSVGLSLLLFFMLNVFRAEYSGWKRRAYLATTAGLFVLSAVFTVYFFQVYPDISRRVLQYTQLEYVLAGIAVIVVLEGTRRAFGNIFTAAIVGTIVYAYFGASLIGPFKHSGVSIMRILETNLLTMAGIYGFIPQVGSTWVAIFLIYAGLLQGYDTLSIFLGLANRIGRWLQSGPGQMAVITSMLMGMINGTSLGNIAVTGSFTIPIMKENGVRSSLAGGIESIASSGGQVMPPIMGAGAFLMASILGVPYLMIVTAGFLPAVLLYVTLVFTVALLFRKWDIRADFKTAELVTETEAEPDSILLSAVPVAISILVLMYTIAWLRYDLLSSGLYTIATLVGLKFAVELARGRNLAAFRDTVRQTLQGMQLGAITSTPIMVALAGVAVMVQMLKTGSLIQEILFIMLDLSSGQVLLLLFLAMVLSLILGMGMPTTAAYILVATLVGPAITEFGIDQLFGHMFVFYFAVFSVLTPPFALACVVASEIADADFFQTAKEALKIGMPLFLLPYSMVIHRGLLQWDPQTPVTFLMVLVGMIGVTMAVFGYLVDELHPLPRVVALIGAVAIMLTGDQQANFVGTALVLAVISWELLRETEFLGQVRELG